MDKLESPYCPICEACGVDGCCSATACQQHPAFKRKRNT